MKSAKNIQEFEKSKYCLQSSLICHEKDSLNILSNIFSVSFHRFNVNAMSISKNQLQIAKILIKNHFDFVIMEDVNTHHFNSAIRSAFFGMHEFNSMNYTIANPGIANFLGIHKYADIMPFKVVERLRLENAADIDLYKFAISTFKQRATQLGWDMDNKQ